MNIPLVPPPPLRVLEVLASGAVGGGATHLRELVTGSDPDRFALQVASSADGPLGPELLAAGILWEAVPMPRALNPGAWLPLMARMRRERIQVVHAHGTRAALAALPAARALGLRTVYTVHGWSCHARSHPLAERLAREAERVAVRLAHAVICVSAADLIAGLRWGLLTPGRAQVIPNGIDPARHHPRPEQRALMRAQRGVPLEAPVAMVVGRLCDQKGHGYFLRAASELQSAHPDARYLLVGDGPDRSRLETLTRALDLQEQVRFLGSRSDVSALLAAADVFVLPSLWEGLPIALLEAMAMEVPAIATHVGGCAELIRPGTTGLLVPPAQVGPLAEAMHALFATPGWARELARAARAQVLARYTRQAMRAATMALYRELA